MSEFTNPAKRIEPKSPGAYGFDQIPPLLFIWNKLFQTVISQAGTHLITGKFHDQDCGIYKAEGGWKIAGVGSLVLLRSHCYLEDRMKNDPRPAQLAGLITHVVLEWEPEDPINSMITNAAEFIGVSPEEFEKAVAEPSPTALGGNALSAVFDWNPFTDPPDFRDYERFCLKTCCEKKEEEINQQFADEDLGKTLLAAMGAKIKSATGDPYGKRPFCCSPSRNGDTLKFWVNTGGSTQLDGWKTEDDIKAFLESDGILRRVDPPKNHEIEPVSPMH